MTTQTKELARPVAVPTGRRRGWAKRLAAWWVARVSLLPPPVASK